MLHFVLIHGSLHTAEHWAPVINHLKSKGYGAVAPTVLGHGKGVEKRVNHSQQVKDLVQQIERQNLRDFVVVGHSYGGSVITAAGTDSRVAALVYIAAFAPDDDETTQSLQEKFPAIDEDPL